MTILYIVVGLSVVMGFGSMVSAVRKEQRLILYDTDLPHHLIIMGVFSIVMLVISTAMHFLLLPITLIIEPIYKSIKRRKQT